MRGYTGGVMLSSAEQVTVLLKEYDALRAEVISRISAQFTLIAVGAAVLGAFLSWSPKQPRITVIALLAACLLGISLVIVQNRRSLHNVGQRLREIEAHVNAVAGVSLMCYENHFGGPVRGTFFQKPIGSVFPIPKLSSDVDPSLAESFMAVFGNRRRNND
jgi:hypothetical protein